MKVLAICVVAFAGFAGLVVLGAVVGKKLHAMGDDYR